MMNGKRYACQTSSRYSWMPVQHRPCPASDDDCQCRKDSAERHNQARRSFTRFGWLMVAMFGAIVGYSTRSVDGVGFMMFVLGWGTFGFALTRWWGR